MHVRKLSLLTLHVCLIHFSSNIHMFWVPKHLFQHRSDIFQQSNQSAEKLRESYKVIEELVIKHTFEPKFLVLGWRSNQCPILPWWRETITLHNFWGRHPQKISTSAAGAGSSVRTHFPTPSIPFRLWAASRVLKGLQWRRGAFWTSCSSYLQQCIETTECLKFHPFVFFCGNKGLRKAVKQKVSSSHTAGTVNYSAPCCASAALCWKSELWWAGTGKACCCFQVNKYWKVGICMIWTHFLDCQGRQWRISEGNLSYSIYGSLQNSSSLMFL